MEEMTEKRTKIDYSGIIVAIDLGSQNVRGMIGYKREDGKIEILFSSKTKSNGIRNGVVINVEEVSFSIKTLILQLRNFLNKTLNEGLEPDSPERVLYDITKVYVGLHGKSIHGELNEISRCFRQEPISIEDISAIESENRLMSIDSNKKIVDVVPSEYIVDDETVVDNPVGCLCQKLRARFLNVVGERIVEDNLLKCFSWINSCDSQDPAKSVKCEPTLVLNSRNVADAVLSPEQKEVGCLLMDFGAQTISVSIYHENKLRFLHVFNFGSNLLTQDIASLRLTGEISEKLKKMYGSTMPDQVAPFIVDLPDKRELDSVMLAQIIESRMKEIANRINNAIDLSGYRAVLDTIVLIGEGSHLNHLIEFMEGETGIPTRYGDIRVLSETSAKHSDIANASVVGIMLAANGGSVSLREVEKPKEEEVAKSNKKAKSQSFKDWFSKNKEKTMEKMDLFFNN